MDDLKNHLFNRCSEAAQRFVQKTTWNLRSKTSKTQLWRIKIHETIDDLTGLVEFSPKDYDVIRRQFEDEISYHAPSINFSGRECGLMISTLHGQIRRIVVYIFLSNMHEAKSISNDPLQYCEKRVGSASKETAGYFIWGTKDGNVFLNTTQCESGFVITVDLISKAIRGLEMAK